MKIEFLTIITFLAIISFHTAFAEFHAVFEQDRGKGLTPEECKQRNEIVGIHFEPDLQLAKLKAENHPAFRELVKDRPYSFVGEGGRESGFSKNCNHDVATFVVNYAIDATENSYTQIRINMDYVSYNISDIILQEIEHAPYVQKNQRPFDLSVKNWNEILVIGKYTGADPKIPDKTFRFPYLVNGGKINNITSGLGQITVDLSARDDAHAIFAFKMPRSYPYTDHDDTKAGHPGHGPDIFVISQGREVEKNVVKSDCFYDVWAPFSGNTTIEFSFRLSYLQGWAFRGDHDVPKYCDGYTLAEEKFQRLAEMSPKGQKKAGTDPYHTICKPAMVLVVGHDGRPACVNPITARTLVDRGWADMSTEIYEKYSDQNTREMFQKNLIGEDEATKLVEKYIKTVNLELKPDIKESDITINADLVYNMLSRGYLSMLDINQTTGLPTSIMPPSWESHYRSPEWYGELQKEYLGMQSNRVEDGDVYWLVSYRTCLDCIADYAQFFVNPMSGKVERTHDVGSYFVPRYD